MAPLGLFHQPISMIEPVRITASAPQTPSEIAVAVPSICPKQHGTSSKRHGAQPISRSFSSLQESRSGHSGPQPRVTWPETLLQAVAHQPRLRGDKVAQPRPIALQSERRRVKVEGGT